MNKNEFLKRFLTSLIATPIIIYIVILGSYYLIFFLFFCFALSVNEWINMAKSKKYLVPGLIILMFSFFSAYSIRYITYFDYNGSIVFLFILFVCILTDLGGYIFGKIIKGPKLTKISPNKTYSGMIGGFFLSILFVAITIHTPFIFSNKSDISMDLFIFIILISAVSQLGDITISFFKRLSKIKDTGKIIPGHGGLLDRVDGMIFAFPFSYLILFSNLFNNF